MELRRITPDDIQEHKEILFISMWKPENETPFDFDVMNLNYVKDYYLDWNKKENDIGFFAVSNGNVIGLAQLRKKRSPNIRFADIPELVVAVKPEFQGQGIASLLINEVIKDNPSRGIRLTVHPKNKKAISLYKKLGFEDYYHDENGFISMILITKKTSFFV